MLDKKRISIIAGVIVTLLALLALLFYKVFPKMKQHCLNMCEEMEAAGIDLPPMGRWMMERFGAREKE